jgi:pimeloyl-ACP methyl ester carboxylesterase
MKQFLTSCALLLIFFTTSAVEKKPSFHVEVVGKGKQAMILIPGLTCPGEVWTETVERYKKEYTCYVISLPGFAGQPAVETNLYLQTMRDQVISYIRDNKLKKPILVGHSLGGFLCLWISATEPDLVGANFIVDALPFLPAAQNPNATPENSKAMAESMFSMMKNSTPEQTKQSQQYFLPMMVTAQDKYDLISQWGVNSNSLTVAKAMYEMNVTDLRNDVAKIKVPVTILGAWIGYKNYGVTKEMSEKMYSNQYKLLPNKTIIMSDHAKHFIMYDDPQWFFEQMDQFLNKIK